MSKVLIVAVHPDDETLGCGGALLKHKANGDELIWLIATEMKASDGFSSEKILQRDKEITKVANEYGFNKVIKLGLSTMKVDLTPAHELISMIGEVFKKVEPEIVYLPFSKDAHSDHRVLFETAYACTKTFRYPSVNKVLMMETISETEFGNFHEDEQFTPNCFIDISEFIDKKIEIMKIYEGELKEHPFPRSCENIKALATFRGASAGFNAAESFMILKERL